MNTYQYTVECRVRTWINDSVSGPVYMPSTVIIDEITAKERPTEADIIKLILSRKDNKQILAASNTNVTFADTHINGVRFIGAAYYCNNRTYCLLNVTSIQKIENKKSSNFSKTFD